MFTELLIIFIIIFGIIGGGFILRLFIEGIYEMIKDREYKPLIFIFILLFLLVLCILALIEEMVIV